MHYLGHVLDHDASLDATATARTDLQQALIETVRDFATGAHEDEVDLPFRKSTSDAMGRPYSQHLLRQSLEMRP
jgi:hypothetical protein